MRVADDAVAKRCPYCRSTDIKKKGCRKCTRSFEQPFIGTRYDRVITNDAAVALPRTIGSRMKW